ncbi:MAG TPA: DUF2390 domain-containing protein [Alcanivoracaceae bacterium]|nr:DUF2390 domain-containing protein [Alcanivoracaceae bacterium]
MDKRFWDFSVGVWRNAEVERLALSVQREHGAVVHFLLGVWFAQTGQAFNTELANKVLKITEPAERKLAVLRKLRFGLEGDAKQEVLQQELTHEKDLYSRLAELVPAEHSPQWELAFSWWSFFFPRVSRAVQEDWYVVLANYLQM